MPDEQGDIMEILAALWSALFRCNHPRFTFPLTAHRNRHRRGIKSDVAGTYVVCLACGKEFGYDWQRMAIVKERNSAPISEAVEEN